MCKHFFIAVLIFCLSEIVSAQNSDEILISMEMQDEELIDVLTALEKVSKLNFYFILEEIPKKKITRSYQNKEISDILNDLFLDTSLGYVAYRSYAIVIGKRAALSQQYDAEFYKVLEENLSATELSVKDARSKFSAGTSDLMNPSGVASISGVIIETDTREPIVGASFYIESLKKGVIADVNGYFQIQIPIGHYDVIVKSFGYEQTKIRLSVYNNDDIGAIGIEREALSLNEVIIESMALDRNVSQVVSGVESITPKGIEDLPTFLGEVDVVKSLVLLPGVSTIGEGASGYNVRGGAIDQNLVLIDEAFVFNSSHALGFFSAINADVVKNASLYKGNIPVQYDGRLSSVLDVELKDANFETFKAKGGIGTVSSRLSLEIPIRENKTSLMFGGRISYSDWMLRRINVPSIQNSSVSFYDINARVTHVINEKNRLSISLYTSNDNVRLSQEFTYDYKTSIVQSKYTNFIGDKLTSNFSLVYSMYDGGLSEPTGTEAFRLNNAISYFKIKELLSYKLNKMEITGGGTYIQYSLSPGSLSPASTISVVVPEELEEERAREIALYVDNSLKLDNGISIVAGVRFVVFENIGGQTIYKYENRQRPILREILDTLSYSSGDVISSQTSIEPRLSANFKVNEESSIKFGYGRTSQFIHQIANATSVAPVDVRQVSNQYIEPQKAHNFSLGYFRNFQDNKWETSIDTYYRFIDQLIEYKDFAQLLLNDHLETELLVGIGRSYGMELSIKKNKGKLTGRLGYTYSRTERKVANEEKEFRVNNGSWFPSYYDKPHDLTFLSKYKINRRHSFSVIFTYSTGRPATAPVGGFNTQDVRNIPIYTTRNAVRIPDYHRLDVAYTLSPGFQRNKKFKTNWTLSLYNLYSRKNAFSVFYSQNPAGKLEATKFSMLGSIFPSITFNLEFQ